MTINFKLAEYIHIDTLVELVQEFYIYDHHHFDAGVEKAIMGLLSDDAFGRAWLICDDKTVIGYVILVFIYSLETHGRNAFVDELYLRENHRGKGLGRQTFQFLEDFCRSVGICALHLEVERENTKAQGFYHKLGYKDHDRYLLTKRLA